jgi:radical SAM protein with 4Fe4S-binding SPASM domain
MKPTVMKVRAFRVAREGRRDIKRFFASGLMGRDYPLFKYVEIETINKCNGTCTFCPVNKNIDPRPLARMNDSTFYKIIDNLVNLNYNGKIGYYSNNEPLMDNRIYDFIKYGVQNLPNAYHFLFTNGTLLDCDKFQTLIDLGLNHLFIDNYNDDLELHPNIRKIYDKYKDKNFSLDCQILIRLNDEVLSNRVGSAPNGRKIAKPIKAQCNLPFRQLIIRADCGVNLCCNDALGRITLGNVEEQTLEEIWFSKKHFDILESIRKNLRIGICKECDIVSLDRYFNV